MDDLAPAGLPDEAERDRPRSDERTVAGHAILYMAPMVVSSLLPIITLPIFTRVLSREEYGLWGIATAFGALVSGAAGLGLQVGFDRNYFAAPDDRARARLLYSVVLFALVAQLAGLALVLVFGPLVALRLMHSPRQSHLLVLAFVLSALGSLKAFFLTTLRNEGRAREYVTFSIDELFLGAALSLTAVLWLRVGVVGLLVGPLLASAIVLAAMAARFLRQTPFGLDGEQLRDTLRVSLPLAPRALIGAVGNQLDRLVLGAVGSLAEVGVYTIAQRMAQFVFASMTALQNVYQPRVYRMLFANAPPDTIGRYLLPFAYGSAAVAFGVIMFSSEIVRIVAPPEYAAAASVLAILAVYYGLMFFGKQPQLVFARRTRIVSALSVLMVALNAGFVYVGAKTGGTMGIAFGLLSAGIITGGVGLFVAWRYAPISYPLHATIMIFGALPLALAVVLSLDALHASTPVGLAVKIFAVAVFAAMGWRSGMLGTLFRARSALAK